MNMAKGNRRKKRVPGPAKSDKRPPLGGPEGKHQETETLRRGAISVFILFHLIAITCWALPLGFSALRSVRELVQPYMAWSGLFQRWDMFASDPTAFNSYVKAVVMTRDRHMHVWSFPRMEVLSFGERYGKERYRKFIEVLPQPQNALLWPDVARHLARSQNSQTDPPDKILLIQFQSEIHPGTDESHQPAPNPSVFYDDYVQPGDLQ
jgi:hypothetical protein